MTPDTSDINLALQLLLIGMVSVFVILGIVVGLGKLLVTLVNKFSPEVVKPQKLSKKKTVFNPKKLAALTAVVDIVTQQQGVIKSIKKI